MTIHATDERGVYAICDWCGRTGPAVPRGPVIVTGAAGHPPVTSGAFALAQALAVGWRRHGTRLACCACQRGEKEPEPALRWRTADAPRIRRPA